MAIIQLKGLSRHYGEYETLVKALDEVTINIEQGEIVALLGSSIQLQPLISRREASTISMMKKYRLDTLRK